MSEALKPFQIACGQCSLAQLCLPLGLSPEETQKLDNLIQNKKVIKKGEQLFRANQPFDSIYAIRSGSFKLYKLLDKGEEEITGFYLPGEILGFHGLHSKKYELYGEALEISSVCTIPFDDLLNLSMELPSLQKHLMAIMSAKLSEQTQYSLSSSAESRLAGFLLSLSYRLQKRQLSSTEFHLSMSREEMGNYLGLATETISRLLTHLQEEDIIKVNRRDIKLKNLRQLQVLSCGTK